MIMQGRALLVALSLLVLGVLVFAGCAKISSARQARAAENTGTKTTQAIVGDPYPLDTCPVSGEKLGGMGDPVIYNYNGREIRFCCNGCVSKFEANPEKYLKDVDSRIIAQQMPYYPMQVCPVTHEELGGEMGEPIEMVMYNRLVRFCCKGCIKQFAADPEKYIAEMDDAVVKAQLADYPLTTCVVTGEKLGEMGDPIDYVFGDRLVRFCCKGCIKQFEADPAKYMAKLDK